MRPLWKGAISFGLVTIPVSLYPAMRREELKFRLLRKSDHSPINYKRVAEADGKEVQWDQIAKGYEYEKGKYVILKEEDFARVDVEATQTVEIINFVALAEVDPLLFYKPYLSRSRKGRAEGIRSPSRRAHRSKPDRDRESNHSHARAPGRGEAAEVRPDPGVDALSE